MLVFSINWVLHNTNSGKLKIFWLDVMENGRVVLDHGTLGPAESQMWIDGFRWFFACCNYFFARLIIWLCVFDFQMPGVHCSCNYLI